MGCLDNQVQIREVACITSYSTYLGEHGRTKLIREEVDNVELNCCAKTDTTVSGHVIRD